MFKPPTHLQGTSSQSRPFTLAHLRKQNPSNLVQRGHENLINRRGLSRSRLVSHRCLVLWCSGVVDFQFLIRCNKLQQNICAKESNDNDQGRTTVMYTRKMIRTWLTVAMVMASAERAHAFGTLVRAPRLHLCKFFHVYVSQKNFMRACCHIHKPRIRTKYITCNIGQTKLLRTGKRVIARPSFYAQPPCRCKTRTVRSRCRHPRRSRPTSWRVQWASEASFMWACSFSSSSWSSSRLPFKILSRPLVSSQVCPFNVTSRATL